jgi:hypothetical protein
MVAGYLGMLPLLQSLAAAPAYPNDAPPTPAAASAAAGVRIPARIVAKPASAITSVVVSSKPTKAKSKKAKTHAAKAHTRTTPKNSSSQSSNIQTHTNSQANTGGGSNDGGGQVSLGSGTPDSNASGGDNPVCNGLGC